jgi:glucokinase
VALPGNLPGLERADLPALLGVRVPLVVNDAIACGVGEGVRGAGRGASRVVVVTLGTGVGVAVVEEGAPLGGGPLGGGLLGGQLPLGGTSLADTSGRTGTFEAHCRAQALVASVAGAADVEGAYAAGGPGADYRRWLVRGLTVLALAHAPDVVVVGGGAARAELLEGVQEAVSAGLWPAQSVQVRLAELGDAAGLVGLQELLRTTVPA